MQGAVKFQSQRKPRQAVQIRCCHCDAPSGEVQLSVVGRGEDGRKLYACKGDCAKQRNKALVKRMAAAVKRTADLARAKLGAGSRLTARGKALRWTKIEDKDDPNKMAIVYRLTEREVARRKAAKKQQKRSRRANRRD